ncbi:hypothetical protein D4764_10G0004260 [Takifugu flavidus]|uniref:C2H2-type domain-containing protein n=1 Tax=Takifugu flavidus TaxID=433684 RepID=A0A5C6PKJ1_9TELE|nr:hypothetical protein D4764_10G0004260 [Takifugu flavidus]
MEKQNLGRESTTFICTECGDGFSKYSNVVTHMAIHGPLESFCFDGSSNGFEVPREYVLQENGTLTVVNGLMHSHQLAPPLSPGVLPSHFTFPANPLSSNLKTQPAVQREVFRPRPSELNLDSYCYFQTHSLHHCKGVEPEASFASEIDVDIDNDIDSKNIEGGAIKNCYSNGTSNDLAPSYCNGEKNTYSPKEKRKSSYEDDDEEDDQATSSDEQPYGKQSLKAGRGNYQCEECGKKFGLLCVYQRHLRYHKKEPTKFPKFPAQFRSVSPEHPLQIHPSCGENSGQMCLGGAPTVETALQHEEVSDRNRNKKEKPSVVLYECSECMETFSCLETFLHHQTSHSSQNEG